MSVNPGPPGDGARRRSPDQLAQEVASLLKKGSTGHQARRRVDIVTVTRVVMALGVLVLGVGVAVAVPWIDGLAGYESPGMVAQGGPVVGCPGELEIGEVFKGETVQVVGRSEDGLSYALRDARGPGDVVYAEAAAITNLEDADRLPTRSCEPRDDATVLAAATTTVPGDPAPTTTTTPTTIAAATPTTTAPAPAPEMPVGRPPRRGASSPGASTTTTTPSTSPTGPGPATTTRPVSPTTTTRPPGTPTTSPSTTTTSTRPPTTSSSTTSTTTSTTTTTTTQPTTTTTEPTTTTTEPESTTTEPTTTTTT